MRAVRTAMCLGVLLSLLVLPGTAHASGGVRISFIYGDSPGVDYGSNKSLNAEYVVIKNTTSKAKKITGWTLRDAAGYVYKFGKFTLYAGGKVKVHTGKGTDTHKNLYWGSSSYSWNNEGDTAKFKTPSGVLVCPLSGM